MEEAKKTKKNRDDKVRFGGLMIWNSRAISTAIFVLVSSFLMIYCTDTLKIPAAMVSMILVASKVLDGITDMFAGFIVDRTETRWGKARPYEIFIVGLWLCGKMRMDLHYVCACKFDLYDVFNSEWNTVYDPRLQR